ncbi:Stf0 family sulfotransferase [Tunicatimonas pelagia]|uniref:Stf0 family sulfotransferase n=1 Tax=Tunicatimonas pelagia TaxID=931531 RepID=UPI002667169F|nr:Stf0 family sulfotransferase [Tunicatimonas pelagia]WKN41785.1 Stf0 family sulfotransferase [Tunicatimonas pelagia]
MNLARTIRKIGKKTGVLTTQRFVIMCHQRSGSNMFTSILDQHADIKFYGQLFKDDPQYRQKINRMGIIPFSGTLFDDEIGSRNRFDELEHQPNQRESRNTKAFVDDCFQRFNQHTQGTCIGVKFHGGTLFREEIESVFLNGNYKVILLRRENLLVAAISWYQARELDQWRRDAKDKVEKPKMTMDIDTLAWFIENTRQDIALWKQLIEKNGINHLELTYEEMVQPGFSMEPVWQHLGIQNITSTPPKTKKLIKKYDHITNLEEIRGTLASDENGYI